MKKKKKKPIEHQGQALAKHFCPTATLNWDTSYLVSYQIPSMCQLLLNVNYAYVKEKKTRLGVEG
jgi:hypothetical protein